jgi:hypothetical protein
MIIRIRALFSLLALGGAVLAMGCVASTGPDDEGDVDDAPAAPTPGAAGAAHTPGHEIKPRVDPICYMSCIHAGIDAHTCACVCGIDVCEE